METTETTEQKVQAGLERARERLGVLHPRTVNESELSGVLGEVIEVVGLLALPAVPSLEVTSALEGARRALGHHVLTLEPGTAQEIAYLRSAIEELVIVVEALAGVRR